MLREGAHLEDILHQFPFNKDVITSAHVLIVQNHFVTDSSTRWEYEGDNYKRRDFEKLLRWKDIPLFTGTGIGPDSSWYDRSTTVMTSRCSLQYPFDRYRGVPKTTVSNFASHVCKFLWRRIKNSHLCCCKSKFYCSSSINLDKCKNDCCGKCKDEFYDIDSGTGDDNGFESEFDDTQDDQ